MKRPAIHAAGLAALWCVLGLGASCSKEGEPSTPTSTPAPSAEVTTARGASDRAEGGAEAPPWFREVAQEAGIDFVHAFGAEQRFDFPEIMGGGAALFDADQDGDLDLYLVQSGDLRGTDPARVAGNRFYLNDGSGTFTDVTAERGGGDTGYGMGCAVGDWDGDGDPDLYVTNVGPNVLYRNDAGHLVDVTEASGTGDPGWGTSAAFCDVDGDGRLDLFAVNYLRWSIATERDCSFPRHFRDYCNPNSYKAPARDVLLMNRGDGTFEDRSEAAGLAGTAGNGLGVVTADLNADGHVDIYVANDMNANHLWLGDGAGSFREGGLLAGCALSGTGFAESGMGVQAVDLDQDGDLDLFLSHLRRQSNTVYSNRNGAFDDTTARMGLSAESLPFTGFGLGFADFDLDGTLDLYVANGDVTVGEQPTEGDPYAQVNLLFAGARADGGATRFTEVLPRGGTRPALSATSRAAAFGDVDGDGDVDAVVVNRGIGVHLLRNIAPDAAGEPRGWISFDVRDSTGATAIGARVELVQRDADQLESQWRLVDSAFSYCAASDPRAHFGLGSAQVETVKVHWRGGEVTDFGALAPKTVHRLAQPTKAK